MLSIVMKFEAEVAIEPPEVALFSGIFDQLQSRKGFVQYRDWVDCRLHWQAGEDTKTRLARRLRMTLASGRFTRTF